MYKAITYTIFIIIAYIIISAVIRIGIQSYLSTFSISKWNNSNWGAIRYFMIDDMEQKYNFIGKSKEEVYRILGTDVHEIKDKSTGTIIIPYYIRDIFLKSEYYKIYLDKNDIVVDVKREISD